MANDFFFDIRPLTSLLKRTRKHLLKEHTYENHLFEDYEKLATSFYKLVCLFSFSGKKQNVQERMLDHMHQLHLRIPKHNLRKIRRKSDEEKIKFYNGEVREHLELVVEELTYFSFHSRKVIALAKKVEGLLSLLERQSPRTISFRNTDVTLKASKQIDRLLFSIKTRLSSHFSLKDFELSPDNLLILDNEAYKALDYFYVNMFSIAWSLRQLFSLEKKLLSRMERYELTLKQKRELDVLLLSELSREEQALTICRNAILSFMQALYYCPFYGAEPVIHKMEKTIAAIPEMNSSENEQFLDKASRVVKSFKPKKIKKVVYDLVKNESSKSKYLYYLNESEHYIFGLKPYTSFIRQLALELNNKLRTLNSEGKLILSQKEAISYCEEINGILDQIISEGFNNLKEVDASVSLYRRYAGSLDAHKNLHLHKTNTIRDLLGLSSNLITLYEMFEKAFKQNESALRLKELLSSPDRFPNAKVFENDKYVRFV